jgi:hypothetical protein
MVLASVACHWGNVLKSRTSLDLNGVSFIDGAKVGSIKSPVSVGSFGTRDGF